MKIGIDARMLGPGFGLARYVQQLVLHLQKIDYENQYVLFMRSGNWDRFYPEQDNFKKVLAEIPWYSVSEQTKFPEIIQKEGVDLMHFPHWNVPLLYRGPCVVTVHDLIMYHYPRQEATTLGPLGYWFKDKMARLVIRNAVKKAQTILATSEFTRQDIHQTLGVPVERMLVTYQAPFDEERGKGDVGRGKITETLILKKYGIDKPYVLYVGAAYPHKNLEGLLQAWKLFQEKYGETYQLIFVGADNFFYKKLIHSSVCKESSNIIFTGFVEDSELTVLYEYAWLYVFPSLYEGFGLPPLEAMTHGVPVVSSNRSCMPEVLGDAALYFDPENYEQMSEVMHTGLTNIDMQLELQQNAREHLKLFSWKKLAKETLGIYERISGKNIK